MALRPAVRDALVLVAVFAVLLGGLYVYTGSWPPAVIVESGSMMHADNEVSYGRFGTIDPGDLVLVKHVDGVDDVTTLVEGGRDRYGKSGDVIVYYPANNRAATPIIHRAVAYVEVDNSGASPSYYVRWGDQPCEGGAEKVERDGRSWCKYGSEGVYIPSVPVQNWGSTRSDPNPYRPVSSGFFTKGDNPVTNTQTDQLSRLSIDENGNPAPVKIEWVEGKARAELPWLGLIKLALAGKVNEPNPPRGSDGHILWTKVGSAYAPKDLWVMLGITLFLLVGVPLIYDGYKAMDARRQSRATPPAPTTLNAQAQDHASVHLSWSHPHARVHSYRVYRDGQRVATVKETHYRDGNLQPATTYAYTVSAVNDYGNEGPQSASVTAHTTPSERA